MEYTMEQRGVLIRQACLVSESKNPHEIFKSIARQDFIRIHGPEHHILDGACFLAAFRNAGGEVDLEKGLAHMLEEGVRMPGATCGLWGVCGAVTSIGTALAFLEGTGPLSGDDSWASHMEYTSGALKDLAAVGGPRCCKRDAFLALRAAVTYAKERYGVEMEVGEPVCGFFPRNQQCIQTRCPFYPNK